MALGVEWNRYCTRCRATRALLVFTDHYRCPVCGKEYGRTATVPTCPECGAEGVKGAVGWTCVMCSASWATRPRRASG